LIGAEPGLSNAHEHSSGHFYSDLQPTVLHVFERSRDFRSLRWKLILPMIAVLVPLAMIATYMLTDSVARGIRDTQMNQLIASGRAIGERAAALGSNQRREAIRVAYTQNMAQSIASGDDKTLTVLLPPLATAGDLDYLIVGSSEGREVVGLYRRPDSVGYDISRSTLLDKLPFMGVILSGEKTNASGIVRTGTDYALFTAAAVQRKDRVIGVIITGIKLQRAMQLLRDNGESHLVVYGPQGEALYLTLPTVEASQSGLMILPGIGRQAVTTATTTSTGQLIPIQNVEIGTSLYQIAYVPFILDSNVLGVIGLLRPNNAWIATSSSRHVLSLSFSSITGGVLLVAFVGVNLALRRLNRVRQTAQALASGDPYARTDMIGDDEIGEVGKAIDVYADRMQRRQESLETLLRRMRVENARLVAVLESIPDGIIVQDLDGRVVLMNEIALKLLGSQRVFRSSPLNELTAIVTDTLGEVLAPGIYSLGDPQRISLDSRILHAQAAAIMSLNEKRLGTVIVLRDITEDVRREQARDAILDSMTRRVDSSTPVSELAVKSGPGDTLHQFVEEVNRNAIILQRLISEIRDLSTFDARMLRQGQRALPVETLMWDIAREWQPVAAAAQVELHVIVLRRALLVLGEERRLRWALGNLVDNAIKYTPTSGHITLMLRATDDDEYAWLSIKDTGVGITADDLPHVFTRFYRGKPTKNNGQVIQTPGTGQGLFIARRVIEAHGGTISLESAAGFGTEAIFTLPLTANVTMDLGDQHMKVKSKTHEI
jgi:signal transduction histidine kinase